MFPYEKNDTNPLLASNFQHPRNHLVHMHHVITALFCEMPELKTPQMVQTGQMGKAPIGFPEWLFSWQAWKKTKLCMTLFHFPPLSLYAWLNETEFSSRSQWVVKVSTLWLLGKKNQGTGSQVKNLHSGTCSPFEHPAELEISPN